MNSSSTKNASSWVSMKLITLDFSEDKIVILKKHKERKSKLIKISNAELVNMSEFPLSLLGQTIILILKVQFHI